MKKIFKRLLSVMLALVMVVGMVPVSAVPVKAESTQTVYVDITNTDWTNVNICAWNSSNSSVAYFQSMKQVGDSKIYKYELSEDATTIVFTKKNNWNNEAKSQTIDIKCSSTDEWKGNVYKIDGTDGGPNVYEKYTGSWSAYSSEDEGSGETTTASTTVYCIVNDADWIDKGVYVYAYNTTSDSIGLEKMTQIAGTNCFYYKLEKQYTNVIFEKGGAWGDDGHSVQTIDLTIDWNSYKKPCFTISSGSGTNYNGTWAESKYSSSITVSDKRFLVDTDLVDFFNDNRYNKGGTALNTDNQGSQTGSSTNVYGFIDYTIMNEGYSMPLYFGDMWQTRARYGWSGSQNIYFNTDDYKWSTGANVAHDKTSSASAQGLVGTKLNDDGNLVDPKDSNIELMYFNDDSEYDSVRAYYAGKKFPFKVTYDSETEVTTYSYDSAKDYAVYYDYDNPLSKNLVESDYHSINKDGNYGYYPFDYQNVKNQSNTSYSDTLNMATGTKFTIPFTLPKDGTVGNNNTPAVFEFTGDDDVWVFIDGYLVLDMGGAHAKSTGAIDFAAQKAVVSEAYEPRIGWGSYSSIDNTVSPVSENVEKKFSDIVVDATNNTTLADIMKDGTRVHTLTMFYMERGMFDSNMSISFTMEVVPSGLSLNNSIKTDNVNGGLVDSLKNTDAFDYKIVQNGIGLDKSVTYRKDKGENAEISGGKVVGLKDSGSADTFMKNGSGFLNPGDKLQIVEEIPEYAQYRYKTDITIADLNNSSKTVSKENTKDTGEFDFGKSTDASVNYNVSYVNTVLTGDITLKKEWSEGNDQNSDEYSFYVGIDLKGGTDYQNYYLEYTVNDETTKKIASGGLITLKPGETVTISGVPIGATYRIQEVLSETSTARLESVTINGTEVTPEEGAVTGKVTGSSESNTDVGQNVVFTNGPKVIYVEAGTTTTYKQAMDQIISITAEDASDDVEVGVKDGYPTFKVKEANTKYTVTYSGKKEDGNEVKDKIIIYSFKATDKVYVFDYGLKSDLTETNENKDGLFEGGVFYNENAKENDNYTTTATLSEIAKTSTTEQTTIAVSYDDSENQTIEITPNGKANGGSVIFTPVAFMDTVENYTYTANIAKNGTTFDSTNPETGTVVTGTIKVMPANVVYYEDNFNVSSNGDSTNKIIYSGEYTVSEEDSEMSQSNNQSEQYGHDDEYNGDLQDSGNTSVKMTSTTNETGQYATKATFKFKGTGFDVVGRTDGTSTTISYRVLDKDDKLVKLGLVDTFYANGTLYQIPVIHEEGLDYAKAPFTVELVVGTSNAGTTFYLDGIRIYNPLNTDADSDYIDTEEGVTVTKVSELILGNGTINETGEIVTEEGETYTEVTGITVPGAQGAILGSYDGLEALGATKTENMDGTTSGSSNSLINYLAAGPNNEIYLGDDAALGFVVTKNQEITDDAKRSLQIEAKLVNVNATSTTTYDGAKCALRYLGADGNVKEAAVVSSATAMYYNIPVEDTYSLGNGKYFVVIYGNNTDNSTGGQCLAFTNLKVKGYDLTNPLEDSDVSDKKLITIYSDEESSNPFVSFIKNTSGRITRKATVAYALEVTDKDSFEDLVSKDSNENPKVVLYANGNEITARAEWNESAGAYLIWFNAPSSRGTFTLELHYMTIDGEVSTDYISAEITVR